MSDNIIKVPSTKDTDDVEYLDIFELDGEVYQVPKNPSAGLALKYLKIQSEGDVDKANYFMLSSMLGDEGYDALANHPALDQDTLTQIIELAQTHLLGGPAEEAKESGKKSGTGGKRQKGSKK